jgi:hypothetical protein
MTALEQELEQLAAERARLKEQVENAQRSILAKEREYGQLKEELESI